MSSYSENNDQVCQMNKNLELLQGVNFFSGFPAQALKIIALLSKTNILEKGDTLFNEGDDPGGCVYIISGSFSFVSQHDKELSAKRLCKAGDLSGTLSLLSPVPSVFSMIAMEESEILTVDRKTFTKIINEFPEVYNQSVTNIIKDIQRWDAQQLKAAEPRCGVSML